MATTNSENKRKFFALRKNKSVSENHNENQSQSQNESESQNENQTQIQNPKKPKNTLKKALAIACVLIVVITAAVWFFCQKRLSSDSSAPIVYIKENSVMVQSVGSGSPFVLTDTFSVSDAQKGYADYIVKSGDGKTIAYPDSVSADANGVIGYKLYYRDIENEKSALKKAEEDKGLLLSQNVYAAAKADEKFDTLMYLKGYDPAEGGKLKVHTLKKEIEIDSNVVDFYISDNGKYAFYTKRSGENISLYKCKIKSSSAKPELLKENILSFYILNDKDFSSYAYISANNELKYVDKKGAEALVSNDVSQAFIIEDSSLKIKNLYYYLTSEATYLWKDILSDDMLEADNADTQKSTEKDKRNEFRKAAAEKSMSKRTKALYCFSVDKKNTPSKNKLCANIDELLLITDDYLVYKGDDGLELTQIKMSDTAKYGYDIAVASEKLMAQGYITVRYKTYTGNPSNITEDYQNCRFVAQSPDKRFFYLAENCTDDFSKGDLYRFDTKEPTAFSETKIDAGVQLEDIAVINSGAVYYRKNASSSGSSEMYYSTGGKPSKLAEGIYKIYPAGNLSVFALADLANERGTLYLCEKSKERKIDTDVIADEFQYRKNGTVFYIKRISDSASSLYRSEGKQPPVLVSEYVKTIG